MRISFTGTRDGMSLNQKVNLVNLLNIYKPESFSHGCFIGADIEAHQIVRETLGFTCDILVYPSNHPTTKALIPNDSDYVAPCKNPLERNKDIINNGKDLLIACPKANKEILRSGTWAAIRYARKNNIKVIVIGR